MNTKPPMRDIQNARCPVDDEKPELNKSNLWYWAVLAMIIIGAAIIRGRLLAMPLERDEGEYAYIAQMMLKGIPPYLSAYSMKLPGIYAVYALIFMVFGQTDKAIHLGLLIVNAGTIFVIFLLTKRLFGYLAAVFAAGAYAVMSLITPVLGLSANAEHFVILPALIGIIVLNKIIERRRLWFVFIAALLFGLAFVIKQHGIFFGIFAAIYLLYSDFCCRPIRWKKLIFTQFVFAAGIILPFAITCLVMWQSGAFAKFWFWTFIYAGRYETASTFREVIENFLRSYPIVDTLMFIWFFSLLGLLRLLFNDSLRKHQFFILGLLVFSFLCVCPGFYFRQHYFILFLPAVAVTAGVGFTGFCDWAAGYKSGLRHSLIAVLAGFLVFGYSLLNQKEYLFNGGTEKVSLRIYDINPCLQSIPIAEYIRDNSSDDATIAVIGSEPQIYFYSRRRAATRYLYTYPLMEVCDYAAEMQKEMIREIETAKPQFLVFVNVSYSWRQQNNSTRTIFDWLSSYSKNFYNVVGLIEIYRKRPSIYHWDSITAGYAPVSDQWIAVFKRKQ